MQNVYVLDLYVIGHFILYSNFFEVFFFQPVNIDTIDEMNKLLKKLNGQSRHQ